MQSAPATLISFLPEALARHLGRRASAALQPEEVRLEGAVLYADISGSTALTERLAERGPEGAELLAEQLNGCFSVALEVIAAHGGELLQFAGDAIIALWLYPPGEAEEAVARAAASALAAQRALGGQNGRVG